MAATRWLEACRTFAAKEKLDDRTLRLLEAFHGEPCEADGRLAVASFDAAEKAAESLLDDLLRQLPTLLAREVDPDQARMFARRARAVAVKLNDLARSSRTGRLLRVGFAYRLCEVVANQPAVQRIRALIDYYYSHAGGLHYRIANKGSELPTPLQLLDRTHWEKAERGIFKFHAQGMTRQGPVHITALRFDRNRFRYQALRLTGDEGTDFPATVARHGAIAGFSGGFFLYSETDIQPPAHRFDPVGLVLADGAVDQPPVYSRPAFVQDRNGHCHLRTIGLKGITITWPNGVRIQIGGVNNARRVHTVPVAFNRAYRRPAPNPGGVTLTFIGRTLTGRTAGEAVVPPVGGFVLTLPPHPEWNTLERRLPVGSRVELSLPRMPDLAGPRDGMAGGPTLIKPGESLLPWSLPTEDFVGGAEPITFSEDETGDQNLLPRLAVGLTTDRHVIVMAADGRNFRHALGLTLRTTASVMRKLGAVEAVNFDGGSSKRLVFQGRTLDLPSTEIIAGKERKAIRPVRTAFLVHSV